MSRKWSKHSPAFRAIVEGSGVRVPLRLTGPGGGGHRAIILDKDEGRLVVDVRSRSIAYDASGRRVQQQPRPTVTR